jgi:hypothetical protein
MCRPFGTQIYPLFLPGISMPGCHMTCLRHWILIEIQAKFGHWDCGRSRPTIAIFVPGDHMTCLRHWIEFTASRLGKWDSRWFRTTFCHSTPPRPMTCLRLWGATSVQQSVSDIASKLNPEGEAYYLMTCDVVCSKAHGQGLCPSQR